MQGSKGVLATEKVQHGFDPNPNLPQQDMSCNQVTISGVKATETPASGGRH
jgi:hypothetical protein